MRVPHQHKASQQALGKDALNEKGFTEGDMVVLSIQGVICMTHIRPALYLLLLLTHDHLSPAAMTVNLHTT